MKIYDCFTFFNELELLEIRLNELSQEVDFFVLVEATFTHQGNSKPLYFEQHKSRFEAFLHKIIHIVVSDIPEKFYTETSKTWILENHQRNCISRGIQQAADDDLILISDLDEIPRKEIIRSCKSTTKAKKILLMDCYYYYVNLKGTFPFSIKYYLLGNIFRQKKYLIKHINNLAWQATVIITKKDLQSAQNCRDGLRQFQQDYIYITNAGWHFSYLGGIEKIIAKIEAFAHDELNINQNKNRIEIEEKIKNGNVLHDKRIKLKFIEENKNLPLYLIENKERFSNLFYASTS